MPRSWNPKMPSPDASRSVEPGDQREIWIVNHYAIAPDMPGGTRHFDMASELAQRGYRVRIFASDVNLSLRTHTRLLPGELFRVECVEDVDFVWVYAAEYQKNNWRRTWNMLSFAVSFQRVTKRMTAFPRPDVIIGSSPHLFGALSAQRSARLLGAHFVLELRDLWPQALVDMGTSERHPGVHLMRWIERYLYSRAEKVLILAKGSQDYLERKGVSSERIVFLPNGVHLGHFQPSISREKSRAKYGFDRFTFVYAGAHGPANSLGTILDAADRLRDLPVGFVLVGDGPEKPRLVEQVYSRGLSNVRLLSPISKTEIPDLMHGADAGIITLRNIQAFSYGVSPNKLFDYMAAARPVLCSVPGDMAEMVEEAQAGIACEPENPSALVQAVRQILRLSPQELATIGENGRRYVEGFYRREVLVDRLERLVLDLPRGQTSRKVELQ